MSEQPSIDTLPSFLATAREQGWDTRPVLLRVQTDLFVNAVQRTADIVASYESMALAMIPVVDIETAHLVATKVAGLPETTDLIRDALLLRGGSAASACIAAMPRIGPNWSETLARSGDIIEARGLASRGDLSPGLIECLVQREDTKIDLALARSEAISLPQSALEALSARARTRPELAKTLMLRTDLAYADKAKFYIEVNSSMRHELREGLERNAALSPRSSLPILRDEEVLRLIATARARDPDTFASELAVLSGLSPEAISIILADTSCELLALFLNLLGIDPEDGAIVFISSNAAVSHSVNAVFSLVEIMRTTSRSTANRIIQAACDLKEMPVAKTGRHLPAMDPAVAYPNDPSRRQNNDSKPSREGAEISDNMTAALRRFLGARRTS
jgi:hypothetical protein